MVVPVLLLGSPGPQNKAVFPGHDHWEGGLFWAPDPPYLVLVPSQVSARSVSDTFQFIPTWVLNCRTDTGLLTLVHVEFRL